MAELKKAASGEDLRLMTCTGSGELFLANQAMLVHVLRREGEELTVNGASILAFDNRIDWTSRASPPPTRPVSRLAQRRAG